LVSLDFDAAEGELLKLRDAHPDDAAAAFEQEWVRELFSRAVDELRTMCAAHGWMRAFEVFRRYDLHEGPGDTRPTYAAIAAETGTPVTTVTNDLALARRQFRGFVLSALRQLTGSEEEYRVEARRLLGVEPA
jgi:hypothetical protein